ncbi:Toxin-antitoxin system, toxin component, PIN domain protein (modular protein) [Desulfosarcina cetonica]|nr:Toxin-antitoxin system, toxin component, PIN domain protein (modular protein) [Desulfosarcina cetonica]
MLKYSLNTNIVIYTMKNRPPKVRQHFKAHHGRMAISTVTLGELTTIPKNSNGCPG